MVCCHHKSVYESSQYLFHMYPLFRFFLLPYTPQTDSQRMKELYPFSASTIIFEMQRVSQFHMRNTIICKYSSCLMCYCLSALLIFMIIIPETVAENPINKMTHNNRLFSSPAFGGVRTIWLLSEPDWSFDAFELLLSFPPLPLPFLWHPQLQQKHHLYSM